MDYFNIIVYLSSTLLLVLAFWEDFVREKRSKEFFNIFKDNVWTINYVPSILQRILDYLFNKLLIRQFFNPWFFFPFSILLTTYFYHNFSAEWYVVIVFITFLSILWYSRETHALRIEQKKNNEIIAGRPLILVAKELGNQISVKNAGNNIAREVGLFFIREDESIMSVNFQTCGIGQKIGYNISDDLTTQIDKCDPNLKAILVYKNFQNNLEFETIYKSDAGAVIKTNVGRFKQISDRVINS